MLNIKQKIISHYGIRAKNQALLLEKINDPEITKKFMDTFIEEFKIKCETVSKKSYTELLSNIIKDRENKMDDMEIVKKYLGDNKNKICYDNDFVEEIDGISIVNMYEQLSDCESIEIAEPIHYGVFIYHYDDKFDSDNEELKPKTKTKKKLEPKPEKNRRIGQGTVKKIEYLNTKFANNENLGLRYYTYSVVVSH